MAWDPNEPGNPAWLSVQASQHGGPLQYLDDITSDARAEEKAKWENLVSILVPALLSVGAAAGIAIKTGYDKLKERAEIRKVQKEKAQRAREALINGNSGTNSEDTRFAEESSVAV